MDPITDIPSLISGIDSLMLFNKIVEDTSLDIIVFDNGIIQLNETLQKLNDLLVTNFRATDEVLSNVADVKTLDNQLYQGTDNGHVKTDEDFFQRMKKVADGGKAIGKAGEAFIDVVESFGELSGTIKKVKSGVEGFSSLFDTLGGLEEMATATETTEALIGASEVIAGAEGIAAATAALGPVGWVIGGGALLAGAIIYSQMDKKNSIVSEITNDDQLRVLNERNFRRLNAIPGIGPDVILTRDEWDKNITKKIWSNKENEPKAFDPITRNFAESNLHIKLPTQQELNAIEMQEKIDDVKKSAVIDSGFFRPTKKSKKNLQKEIDAIQKRYEIKNRPEEFHIPTDEEWENAGKVELRPTQGTKRGLPDLFLEKSRQSKNESTGRTVIINLNRPMIDQFTINTQSTKESLHAFKHKVEEVLLEILNSVN